MKSVTKLQKIQTRIDVLVASTRIKLTAECVRLQSKISRWQTADPEFVPPWATPTVEPSACNGIHRCKNAFLSVLPLIPAISADKCTLTWSGGNEPTAEEWALAYGAGSQCPTAQDLGEKLAAANLGYVAPVAAVTQALSKELVYGNQITDGILIRFYCEGSFRYFIAGW